MFQYVIPPPCVCCHREAKGQTSQLLICDLCAHSKGQFALFLSLYLGFCLGFLFPFGSSIKY